MGSFEVGQAQKLTDINEDEVSIFAPSEAVAHMPQVLIESEDVRRKVVHGQPIPAVQGDENFVALIADRELVAIAERKDDMFKPRVVLEGQG